MALPASGSISLGQIQTEFGGANPIGINEYYRGGGYVPNISQNNAIPLSGTISLSQFYNTTGRVSFNLTISSNTNNYVFNTAKVTGYTAGVSDVTLTINSGVYVSSSSTASYALDIDTSWNAGDTLTIINNGTIVGMGGSGGRGQDSMTNAGLTGGGAGGPALRAQRAVKIQNNGTIAGGGGGGGGGGAYYN